MALSTAIFQGPLAGGVWIKRHRAGGYLGVFSFIMSIIVDLFDLNAGLTGFIMGCRCPFSIRKMLKRTLVFDERGGKLWSPG
jgi:hypothetical protein